MAWDGKCQRRRFVDHEWRIPSGILGAGLRIGEYYERGSISNTNGYISNSSVALVDGAGSSWTNSGELYVGYNSGDLSISDGGLVPTLTAMSLMAVAALPQSISPAARPGTIAGICGWESQVTRH